MFMQICGGSNQGWSPQEPNFLLISRSLSEILAQNRGFKELARFPKGNARSATANSRLNLHWMQKTLLKNDCNFGDEFYEMNFTSYWK